MPTDDTTRLLHDAADGPVARLDHADLRRRARRRQTVRQLGAAAAVVALVVGAGAVAFTAGLWPVDRVVIGQDPMPPGTDAVLEAMEELDEGRDFDRLEPEAVNILNSCLADLGLPAAEVPDGYFAAIPRAGQVPPYAETDPERGFGYATQPDVLWFAAFGVAANATTPLFDDAPLRPADGSTTDERWSAAVDACTREAEQHVRRFGMPEPLFEAALEARDQARDRIEEAAEQELAAWQECMGDWAVVGSTPQQLAFHKANAANGAVASYVNSNDPPAGPPPPKLPDELAATLAELAEDEVAAARRNQQCLASSGLRDAVERFRADAAADIASRTESNLRRTEPPLPGLPALPVTLDLPPEGEVASVHLGERPVFVIHRDDGEVLVVDAISPHQGSPYAEHPKVLVFCRQPWTFRTPDEQTIVDTPGTFEDLWHASRFALDGAWLGGPAPTGLPRYQVLSAGDGTLEIGPPGAAPEREVGPFPDALGREIHARPIADGRDACTTEFDQTRSEAQPTDSTRVLWHQSEYPDQWTYPFNQDH